MENKENNIANSEIPQAGMSGKFCPSCGAMNPMDSNFCILCGTKIANAVLPAMNIQPIETVPIAEQTVQTIEQPV